MSTDYEVCVILEGGGMLFAEKKLDMASAQKWAIEYSSNPGVNRVIITETERRVLFGYKDGEMERPHGI